MNQELQSLNEQKKPALWAERISDCRSSGQRVKAWCKSALGKAFPYLKEQWPYLTNYLKDGRLELSINRAERSMKPFVIDRKNFLLANTPRVLPAVPLCSV